MKPNLAKLLEHWQGLLRLRDWRIDARYVRDLSAPDGSPVHGLCSPFVDAKRAQILIRDPETPATKADPAVEETLIHELLHLHFAPLAENSGPGIAAEEQAVWAITEAIASVKDAGARARLARAVVGAAAQRTPRQRRERKQGMDPILLAALKAALSSEDPKAAVEAILAQLEGGGGEGAPAEQGAGPDDGGGEGGEENEPPRAQRPSATPAAPVRQAAAPVVPAVRRAVVPASGVVSRREFDRFRVATLLEKRPDLTEAQRAFGAELSFDVAERWLKTIPVPSNGNGSGNGNGGEGNGAPAAPTGSAPAVPARAARPTAPTVGAAGGRSTPVENDVLTHIDRRMGIAPPPEQAVSRDPRTGRLQISALQPVRLKGGQ